MKRNLMVGQIVMIMMKKISALLPQKRMKLATTTIKKAKTS